MSASGKPSSRPGVPASVYDDLEPTQITGEAGALQELVNRQGLRLQTYFWPAEDAKAVLVFVPGHGSSTTFELLKSRALGAVPQYEGSWVQAVNQAGVSVCGLDNQGCGLSEALGGHRFYVDSFDDYVEDVLQFTRSLDDAPVPGFKGLPRFVMGGSLGGCIAYTAIRKEGSLFRGAVLLAPMLSLDRVSREGCNPYLKPVSSLITRVWPTAELAGTTLAQLPFPELLEEINADPLLLGSKRKTRVRNATEYLRATERIMRELEQADFPFLLFHSERDTMCDCDGSKQLFLKAKSSDKTLRHPNTMWHVLLKEPGSDKVREEIVEWVLSRA